MSKIYRRPMFRGGGSVSSYGNGITAPLVPGYQMGGNVRGGIVDLPGGYNQTANKRLLNNIKNDFGNPSVGMSGMNTNSIGANVVANAANKFSNNVAPLGVVNLKSENEENNDEIILKSDILIPNKKRDLRTDSDRTADPKSASDGLDYLGDGITDEMLGVNTETVDMKDVLVDVLVDGKIVQVKKSDTKLVSDNADGSLGTVTRVLKQSAIPNDAELPKNMKSFPRDVKEMGVDSEIDKIITNPGNEDNTLATTEVSAEDAMKENQELFKKLLGSKKARGQDISDMLLRFSGSEGNTVGEKFKSYTKAESAAGPGRLEKINQTAAALAINDYVAGKRSLEQIDKLKEVERFKNDEAMSRVNITKEDSFRDALNKKAVALKAGTTSSSKVVGETIRDILNIRQDSTPVITVGKEYKDLADINKKIDKIKVGINVIVLKDGSTIVVEKESENSTAVIPTPFKV